MSAKEKWASILQEALAMAAAERPNQPYLGTHFRQLVDLVAKKHAEKFPPDEEPNLRFIELLERFPDLLIVRRRGGQDVLIAPAEKPEVFAQTDKWPAPGVRQDFFNAFVRISVEDRAWYDRESDAIVWSKAEGGLESPSLVPIPQVSLGDALAVRRSFAETLDPPLRQELEAALSSARPLPLFSTVIRSRGLGLGWHVFQTQRLAERIAAWAREAGIRWREEWLTATGPQPQFGAEKTAGDTWKWRAALIALAGRLDETDLARISVPLDVVLKALMRRL